MEASLPCRSEAFEYYLAEGLAAFDQRVRACQIRGVDTAHRDLSGRSHTAGFDQARHLVQEHALLVHVGRLEDGAREHQFPMQRK